MATSIKISQLPAKGANLEATDLLEVSEFNGTGYVSKSITGAEIIASVPPTTVEWGDIGGTLSAQTDLNTALSGKQDDITLTTTGTSGASTFVANTLNVPTYSLSGLGGVPTSRTLTINGTTQDLSADRTFTISTGITIGTTAITSGTVGRVLFEGAGNVVQESANLFWDNTNGRLGIGGTPGAFSLDVNGTARVQGLTTIRTLASSYNSPLIVENTGSAAVDNKNVATFIGARGNASNIDDNTNIGIWQKSNIVNNYGVVSFFNSGGNLAAYFGAQFVNHGASPTGNLLFGTVQNGAPSTRMTLFSTGNLAINTTTDAGFKLDVNGTARVVTSIEVNGKTLSGGASALTTNTAYGQNNLTVINTLGYNTAIGYIALQNNRGEINTALGSYSLTQNTTGSQNVGIGGYAGSSVTSGSNNVLIGYNSQLGSGGQSNQIVIGFNATGAGSNTATFGNTSIVDTILRGRINLQQYATVSRPTYVKGALIYDSTLSKLVVGGATDWEVVTSI